MLVNTGPEENFEKNTKNNTDRKFAAFFYKQEIIVI